MYIHTPRPKSSQLYQDTLEKPAVELWMCLYPWMNQTMKGKKKISFIS